MTATLLFLACIADRCAPVQVGPMPWGMCAMRGQAVVSEWLASHPGRVVVGGWRCETGRRA